MTELILISKREAAKALSISVRTLDYLIAAKELTVRRVGRRCLIPRKSLEDFARRDHATGRNENVRHDQSETTREFDSEQVTRKGQENV